MTPVGNNEDEFQLLRGHVRTASAKQTAKGDVAVRSTPEGLVISLHEAGFFDDGYAEIRATSQAAFGRLAKVLSETPSDIRIEGPTDHVPRFLPIVTLPLLAQRSRFASWWPTTALIPGGLPQPDMLNTAHRE
jgi:hypothetical protein